MSQDDFDIETTLRNLRKSSQTSLTMVILGALALVASLIYSATRLAPLEEDIRTKSARIEKLRATEADYLEKIDSARAEYAELRSNIEQLYAVRVTRENRVFELKATAKATDRITSAGPGYNFVIFVNAPEETLRGIERVRYHFDHPSFRQKIQDSSDRADRFAVRYFGWGCLTSVPATLYLTDGEVKEIDFNMCQSLGPQWWNDTGEVQLPDEPPTKHAPAKKSPPLR